MVNDPTSVRVHHCSPCFPSFSLSWKCWCLFWGFFLPKPLPPFGGFDPKGGSSRAEAVALAICVAGLGAQILGEDHEDPSQTTQPPGSPSWTKPSSKRSSTRGQSKRRRSGRRRRSKAAKKGMQGCTLDEERVPLQKNKK